MAIINGKETEMKFDMGMARIFKKHTKKDLFNMGKDDYKDTEIILGMLYAAAKRGNPDITVEDIDCLSFGEMAELIKTVNWGLSEFMPEADGEADPLVDSPQS
jgi:hypothetical protein